jgi:nucleoid-associated protein YgaU
MAKPHPQAGHGAAGGTADESSLAHGEAAGRDAHDDGEHEADWDVPTAPDNSTLSRILGVVLVVVVAGVFSFVAYRKYDEARRNPGAGQVAENGGTDAAHAVAGHTGAGRADTRTADPLADPTASPFGNEREVNGRDATGRAAGADQSKSGSTGIARNNPASNDAFSALEQHEPGQSEPPTARNPQENRQGVGSVSLNRNSAAGHSSSPAAQEADANPFGEPGVGGQGHQSQQAPTQSEPPQQFAGGSPTGIQHSTMPAAGMPQTAGGPHSTATGRAGADGDMQNLFPDEATTRHDRPAANPANASARPTSLEPTGLTRTAQAQAPTGQGEPLDNELLDESHAGQHPAAGNRGFARLNDPHEPNSAGATPAGAATTFVPKAGPIAGTPTAGRAQALLESKEPTPNSEESPFGGSSAATTRSTSTAAHPTNQPVMHPNTQPSPRPTGFSGAGTAGVAASDPRQASPADDPFPSNQSTPSGGASGKPAVSAATDRPVGQPGQFAASPGVVSPVGTTSDASDYYVVQPTDSFWTISRKKYGTTRYSQALAEANKSRIPDPSRMQPGMKISTPPAETLEERYGQFLPNGTRVQTTAAEDASAKAAPTGFFVTPDGTPKYRTAEHDTLSDIARKHLGRSSRWIQIYQMNRDKLSNPNQLKVGTELALPGDASAVAGVSDDEDRR